jgi:hypothetical protein
MSSSVAQLPSHRGGTCRHCGAVIGCRAPQTLQTERGLRRQPAAAVIVSSRMSGRRPCRSSLCLPCGRPSNWSGGHPVSRRPVSRRPMCSGCPDRQASGVRGRCIRAVRTALDPGRRCRGTGHRWRTGFDVSLRSASGLVVAARMGPGGKGWSNVGRARLARVSTADWAAAWYAHRLRRCAGRLADQGAGSAPGAGRLAGRAGKEQARTRPPQVLLGRLPA